MSEFDDKKQLESDVEETSKTTSEESVKNDSETEEETVEKRIRPQRTKEEKDRIFEKEFLPNIESLYNFAYHLTYNEDDANDLVQEAFMKGYRFINSYIEGTNAKAWLFKILKNAFINEYRKRAKKPTQVDYEEIVNFHDSDTAGYVKNVDLRHEIFEGMLGDEVAMALNALPVDFKTVVLLCDVEGFTYEEMAKIIDIPIGTVRSRLHRARNMLKTQLTTYAAKMGYTSLDKNE